MGIEERSSYCLTDIVVRPITLFMNTTTTAAASEVVRWSVVGYRVAVYQAIPGDPNCPVQAAGCCDKCSASIKYVYRVKSTLGEVMEVGSDCAVTMAGGPELAELRRAERAYQHQMWLESDAGREATARRGRQAAEREARKAVAEEVHELALFGLRAIIASPNTNGYEADTARAVERRITEGQDWDVDCLDEHTVKCLGLAVAKALLPAATRFLGQPKDKIEAVALFEAFIPCESAYGVNYLQKFRTADGALIVWFSKAGDLGRDDLGTWVRIKGTVKAHEEFRGERQTKVLRVKTVAL